MNKIVVYCAIFGAYEGLIEQRKFKGIDYVCYTDNTKLKSKSWQIQIVKPPVPGDATRSSRYFKINPHLHLPAKYKHSVFVDGNILLLKNIYDLVFKNLKLYDLMHFDHMQAKSDPRDCIYDEVDAIEERARIYGDKKADPIVMHNQVDGYRKQGYPKNNGLIFSAILIRNHFSPEVVELMNSWWTEVFTKSQRDQLSFDYVVWKNKFENRKILPGDLRKGNPWFFMISHRQDFRWKVFRIRMKRSFHKLFGKYGNS